MRLRTFSTPVLLAALISAAAAQTDVPAPRQTVPLYGVFEQSFMQSGDYANPYLEMDQAEAVLTAPDGRELVLPLFWDGGDTWRLRFSPDAIGDWTWSVRASDAGLNGEAGSLNVAPSDDPGGMVVMKDHPRHFATQNGAPAYFLGDTAWGYFTNNRDEQLDWDGHRHYADTRAGQGFNAIHSMLISTTGWGNDGGDAFRDMDEQIINPAYWQEIDKRLAHLNERGITSGLALAWAVKPIDNPNNWQDFPDMEARERYVRYVSARYGAYDVYFILAGEWAFAGCHASTIRFYNTIGKMLDAADPHDRLITIHPVPGRCSEGSAAPDFGDQDWFDFGDYQQNYVDLHQRVLQARDLNDGPIVHSEYAYYLRDQNGDGTVDKDNSVTLQDIRNASWDIAMGGAYLITGFGSTYHGGWQDPGPFNVDAPRNDDWEEDVQHLKKLFTSLEWWKLSPAPELVDFAPHSNADQKRPVAPPAEAVYALADPGRQYVFYVRGRPGEVAFKVAEGNYAVRQYDPRTGEFTDRPNTAEGGMIRYTPPDAQDWLLVATKP